MLIKKMVILEPFMMFALIDLDSPVNEWRKLEFVIDSKLLQSAKYTKYRNCRQLTAAT